uniref:PucR family transcriptional regulator n=1 Tax=Herbidospora sakaeratensis TaxID=564415 RepID=UPI000784C767|nr:PucR family transcriptional regulator [Herbidospora sakaeratensis]
MAPSLRRITTMAGLRVLAGSGALDRPVRWVAVSELEDPTPFLEGDELVLTTGMRTASWRPYITRLVSRGVAGLGFGIGLSHARVPAELVAAAAEAGLPLVEVARETPFIAIGKAVSDLLAAEHYEEITGAFEAQGRLTRAALRGDGAASVADRLARELGGWVVLLDETGTVRHATPPEAQERAAGLRSEFARLRSGAAAVALAGPQENVVVQPLGGRGFFAVGAGHPFTPIAHTIVNAAASLLTLALEQGAAPERLRSAVLRLLVAGETETARAVLSDVGVTLPDDPVVVLAVAESGPIRAFHAPHGDATVVICGEAEMPALRDAFDGPVGISLPGPLTCVATAVDQAVRAYRAGRGKLSFADLAGQGLLDLLDPEAVRAYAAVLLAPLDEQRGDLRESLQAYLACNGHWDAAAQRLGVHRHTLRYRMKKAADLLGRDLDDPAARAELWIALSAPGAPGTG